MLAKKTTQKSSTMVNGIILDALCTVMRDV
jgi:hypothetical protein